MNLEAKARRVRAGTRDRDNWLQLVRFALVGASGYAVNLVFFALLSEAAGLHHALAAIGAFCVAVANNYCWNRRWTFADTGAVRFQAARFFTVSLAGLAVNLVVLEGLIGPAQTPPLLAQAVAVAVATPVNFIGNKLWTFDSTSL